VNCYNVNFVELMYNVGHGDQILNVTIVSNVIIDVRVYLFFK